METSKVVRDWLSEYKSLSDKEINSYASTILHNDDLIAALYQLFEEELQQELPFGHPMVDPVCHQLFEFYRSGRPELQCFTLQLVPTLTWAYLSAISKTEKRKVGGIEVCLLGIYNLEIVNKDGSPKVRQFTIPTLAVPSIYHEPPTLATLALTESALMRYHSDEPMVIVTKPLPQTESLNAQNRLNVLTHVLSCYNDDIANLSSLSHSKLCKLASRLAKTGFDSILTHDMESIDLSDSMSSTSSSRSRVKFQNEPRITLNSGILVEILTGIYYAMFNGQAREGMQALEDIHSRACYELFADVLLVTNAIKNSLLYNPSGQPKDGPMGISVALSPTNPSPANTFAKRAITNASFRAKKLPEDIDVPEGEGELPPKYEEVVDGDSASVSGASSSGDKSKFNITNPIKSIIKKDKNKVARRESDVKKGRESKDRESGGSPRHSGVFPASSSLNGDMVDLNMVQVSVVRSSSAQRSIVDSVNVRSSLDSDSQHRRTSSFPENMGTGSEAATHDGRPTTLTMSNSAALNDSKTSSNNSVQNITTHF